jgi:hypothetical protein
VPLRGYRIQKIISSLRDCKVLFGFNISINILSLTGHRNQNNKNTTVANIINSRYQSATHARQSRLNHDRFPSLPLRTGHCENPRKFSSVVL